MEGEKENGGHRTSCITRPSAHWPRHCEPGRCRCAVSAAQNTLLCLKTRTHARAEAGGWRMAGSVGHD